MKAAVYTQYGPPEEAAALPQAGAIALQGIHDKGQVQPGQKVLINGGGAAVAATPLGILPAARSFAHPQWLAWGICSSVIPYGTDQPARLRLGPPSSVVLPARS